jgi:hypothetical protein
MSHLESSTSSLQPTEIIGQGAISGKSQRPRYASFPCYAYQLLGKRGSWAVGNSPHTAWIHILDDDSLLNVFYLYRPVLLGEEPEDQGDPRGDAEHRYGGERQGVSEHWWYKLAHVCQ